jgi:hypothetical protein
MFLQFKRKMYHTMPLFTLAALDYPFCQCYKNGLRDFAGRDFFAKTLSTEGHAFKKKDKLSFVKWRE